MQSVLNTKRCQPQSYVSNIPSFNSNNLGVKLRKATKTKDACITKTT